MARPNEETALSVGRERALRFDNPHKPRSWHTALFYLAEHVRFLTAGAINHKELYALVGIDGRFVNHDNPIVRKRTAGKLSRIMHSRSYVDDLQHRYLQETAVFDDAGSEIAKQIMIANLLIHDELYGYVVNEMWPDIWCGLLNEKASFRPELDIVRLARESEALFGLLQDRGITQQEDRLAHVGMVVGSFLRMVAFGHLDPAFARSLFAETPRIALNERCRKTPRSSRRCLVRYVDSSCTAMVNYWILDPEHPTIIGRYPDCDVIDSNPDMSRQHCCVYQRAGIWLFEDLGSTHGSRIDSSDGTQYFGAEADEATHPTILRVGDLITLAGSSVYWFGTFEGDGVFNESYANGQMLDGCCATGM